jgi:hypothetical protein
MGMRCGLAQERSLRVEDELACGGVAKEGEEDKRVSLGSNYVL